MNIKDLQALNLGGSYQGEPHTQPPSSSCTKPWQLTVIYSTQIWKEPLHICSSLSLYIKVDLPTHKRVHWNILASFIHDTDSSWLHPSETLSRGVVCYEIGSVWLGLGWGWSVECVFVGSSGGEWCLWRELSVKEWIYVSVELAGCAVVVVWVCGVCRGGRDLYVFELNIIVCRIQKPVSGSRLGVRYG